MRMRLTIVAVCAAPLAVGACNQTYNETEGLTFQAGNAVAHNTALQLVDPWPAGVQDTNLVVPADRNGSVANAGAGPAPAAAAPANAPADD